MGMLVTGLNLIRDLHSALMTHIEWGQSMVVASREQTDINISFPVGERAVESSTTTSQQLVKVGRLIAELRPSTTCELIWKTDSPELAHSRVSWLEVTLAETGQVVDFDLVAETRWFYKGANQ